MKTGRILEKMLSQQEDVLCIDMNSHGKLQLKVNPATWSSCLETSCSPSHTACSPQNLMVEAVESLEILLWDSTL